MPNKNLNKKSKTSLFKKRFDLTNRKVQFFVVIGIFAILGGGYFTFRSFAAEGYVIATATPSNNLQFAPGNASTDCGASKGTDTGKNNIEVIGILCKPGASNFKGKVSMVLDNFKPGNTLGQNVRTCTYLKATTANTTFNIIIGTFVAGQIYSKPTVVIPTDRYVTVCSDWVRSPVASGLAGEVELNSKTNQATGGYIQSIRFESQQPLPAAAPTPAK